MNYRTILNLLPHKIANSFFARILNKLNFPSHSKYFINAPLKYAKGFRMNLFPSDIGHRYIAFTGIYELELTKLIVKIAKNEGGLLVDVGANYGYFSILWAQKKSNKVIAFEASPLNFPHLNNNIKLNDLKSSISCFELAISNKKGELKFELGPKDQTGWGGITDLNKEFKSKNRVVNVASNTLDNFIIEHGINEVTVLKIDTEGADVLVLEGASKIISSKKIKHIFWEENITRMDLLGINKSNILNLIEKSGYIIKKIGESEYYAHV